MPDSEPILERLAGPSDVSSLSVEEKNALAEELRALIIETCSKNGGHLASNLGVIELTIALLSTIDPEEDKVVFDVGHQCYAWKILTDRRDRFDTLRTENGLSGFPNRSESPYDAFGTGHSSTSISAALGISRALRASGRPGRAIALIGDGALSGGMAYEAINDASQAHDPLLIILNDNQHSIDLCVGGMAKYLEHLRVSPRYIHLKTRWEKRLEKRKVIGPPLIRILAKLKYKGRSWKRKQGVLFEQLGLRYYGPVDGHDIEGLERHLRAVRHMRGPVLLHVITQKGKGYERAEEEPCRYHGVSPFPVQYGLSEVDPAHQKTFSEVFGEVVCRYGRENPKVYAITAAMKKGTGLTAFADAFPDRFYDVGIAEQHAVTLAAGLAAEGMNPIVAIYSTFLQRAMDQMIHDVCLQKLPVVFAVDRAGLVGSDGPTHQGLYDLSMCLNLPHLIIMAPATAVDLERVILFSRECKAPLLVRYPRDRASTIDVLSLDDGPDEPESFADLMRLRHIRSGNDLTVLALGPMIFQVLQALDIHISSAYGIDLYSALTARPFDYDNMLKSTKKTNKLLIVEDACDVHGWGEQIASEMYRRQPELIVKHIGVSDPMRGQATRKELFAAERLDANGLGAAIIEMLNRT